jgi:DNA replication protein DnaC
MDRDTLMANLNKRIIDDETHDRIRRWFPLATVCPTCHGHGKYNLNFKTYECDCEVQKRLQQHYFSANIGREYHDICLTHFQGPDRAKVVPVVQAYIDNYEDNFHYGLGLTFNGPLGTGKTFAMTCVLKELVKEGEDVYMVTFEELINIWGSSYRDDEAKRLERRLKTTHVLGLDELRTDARNSGGFLSHGLDSVIRHRTANLLPTLVTTNMEPTDELDQFGKVYSLLAAKNRRVETHGHDRRMKEVRDENATLAARSERRPIC